MSECVAAIDQGTTSTRFVIFDRGGNEIGKCQMEHADFIGWAAVLATAAIVIPRFIPLIEAVLAQAG